MLWQNGMKQGAAVISTLVYNFVLWCIFRCTSVKLSGSPQRPEFVFSGHKTSWFSLRARKSRRKHTALFCGVCPEFILIHLCKSLVFAQKILKAEQAPVRVFSYSVLQIYDIPWDVSHILPLRCVYVCMYVHKLIHIQSLILITLDRQDEFPSTF